LNASVRRGVLVVCVLALTVAACGGSGSSKAAPSTTTTAATPTTPTTKVPSVRVEPMSAPTQLTAPKAQWLRITRTDGKRQLIAVYRPTGTGLHPVVVVFHGSTGLTTLHLSWAAKLAQQGFVVVAGCYLDSADSPRNVVLPCPGLPDYTNANAANSRPAYSAILDAAVGLEGVEPGSLGVIGTSLGADVVLGGDDPRVKAIVADSGYREGAGATQQPVLLLGFLNDPNVPHAKLVAFARAQRTAGNPVEAQYFAGASHVSLLDGGTTSDATTLAVTFLRKHLGR
jgi:dienelactone hydrolase